MQILQRDSKRHYAIFLIILALSAYVHLWNPVGFPDIFFDEGVYMRRAMNVLETGNPQEGFFYDHPYLGQLVLAGFLKAAGFPQSVEQSLELSYLAPRLLMGALAILDTFLIYQIAKKKHGRKIAILSSVLFAVMPISWLLRRILLDNLLLPLALSSILLAVYSQKSSNQNALIFGSSVLLGLAIFTKITAIVLIPVVAYVIFSGQKNFRGLIKWTSPVFLIPALWPMLSLYFGHLDLWVRDVFWQAQRGSGEFLTVTWLVFAVDPVFSVLAFASFVYAILSKRLFLILWFAPFMIFVNAVGFFQHFHYVLILPVMCLSIAFMLESNIKKINNAALQHYTFVFIVAGLAFFGLISSSIVISSDMTSNQFDVMEFILHNFDDSDTTLLASPVYSWIFSDVYQKQNVLPDYSLLLFEPVKTEKTMLIADPHFIADFDRGVSLQETYDKLSTIQEYRGNVENFDTNVYPYSSMLLTREESLIEIKVSPASKFPQSP